MSLCLAGAQNLEELTVIHLRDYRFYLDWATIREDWFTPLRWWHHYHNTWELSRDLCSAVSGGIHGSTTTRIHTHGVFSCVFTWDHAWETKSHRNPRKSLNTTKQLRFHQFWGEVYQSLDHFVSYADKCADICLLMYSSEVATIRRQKSVAQTDEQRLIC